MKIVINGILGFMGKEVRKLCDASYRGSEFFCGVDVFANGEDKDVFSSLDTVTNIDGADCIVDFSHHEATPALLEYAVAKNVPVVLATTGHTDEEKEIMIGASKNVAIFSSGNMSIGINLLMELCRKASETLGLSFDVEIIEKHHNQKLDAPSGTALMLADAVKSTRDETEYVYDRHSVRRKREASEIGIHSVRGGTIVGEHEVLFAGSNEVISLSHSAGSREIFATGALRAAAYVAGKSAGLYNMSDLINNK